jgi:hypothetical protein
MILCRMKRGMQQIEAWYEDSIRERELTSKFEMKDIARLHQRHGAGRSSEAPSLIHI